MARQNEAGISGRDHYSGIYKTELDLEAQWLRYCAPHKVDSIELLLSRQGIKPSTVLELGCGPGAIITECQRRGLGENFTAVDYSVEAISYLASNSQDIRCVSADITDPEFNLDQSFDLVVLSHVLEHLEDPSKFLRSLAEKINFRYLIAEVPFEDLICSRMKNLVRDRRRNVAGHVQFFTPRSFAALLYSVDLKVLDRRTYVPVLSPEVIKFVCAKDNLSKIWTPIKMVTNCYLPRILKPLWARFYYAHGTALCVRGNK